MSFLFGTPIIVDFTIDGENDKQKITKVMNKKKVELPIFGRDDTISGEVNITLKDKKFEHQGIRAEFIGIVEHITEKSLSREFINQTFELARPGVLTESTKYVYQFPKTELKHDSYWGANVRIRYFVRVTASRQYGSRISKEKDFWVVNYSNGPESISDIQFDVGVDKALTIKFKYQKNWYHLKDVVLGQVFFKTLRLSLVNMEISVIRKETSGNLTETDTLGKFEIMDGNPVKGETMPIRLFLNAMDLTPTYEQIEDVFSVRYYLHLMLVGVDGNRYFKQTEIHLWRQKPVEDVTNKISDHSNTNALKGCQDKPLTDDEHPDIINFNSTQPDIMDSVQQPQEQPSIIDQLPTNEQPSVVDQLPVQQPQEQPSIIDEPIEQPKNDISDFISEATETN